jgi:hypothetical protein
MPPGSFRISGSLAARGEGKQAASTESRGHTCPANAVHAHSTMPHADPWIPHTVRCLSLAACLNAPPSVPGGWGPTGERCGNSSQPEPKGPCETDQTEGNARARAGLARSRNLAPGVRCGACRGRICASAGVVVSHASPLPYHQGRYGYMCKPSILLLCGAGIHELLPLLGRSAMTLYSHRANFAAYGHPWPSQPHSPLSRLLRIEPANP